MSALAGTIDFSAVDVTGTHFVDATDVQRELPAGAVASALAHKMSLPNDVPWALRSDSSLQLEDDVAIGDQIDAGTLLTIFPRTHLAGLTGSGS